MYEQTDPEISRSLCHDGFESVYHLFDAWHQVRLLRADETGLFVDLPRLVKERIDEKKNQTQSLQTARPNQDGNAEEQQYCRRNILRPTEDERADSY